MKNVKAKTNEQIAMQVSANSIAVNLMLSIFKLIAGLMASSGAMISDAIHSASDVFSTIIVIIGVKISGKASDEDHPYGHDRFECVAYGMRHGTLLISFITNFIGFITFQKKNRIVHGNCQLQNRRQSLCNVGNLSQKNIAA